jgi:hypothetical protein
VGNYRGTVNYRLYQHPDVVNPIKDTTYTDVLIRVENSENTKPKETRVNLDFGATQLNVSYKENIPVSNGIVAYYTSERGPMFSYSWTGQFINDSLNLTYKMTSNRYINVYDFKAKKQ